jgi:hypothetical protein
MTAVNQQKTPFIFTRTFQRTLLEQSRQSSANTPIGRLPFFSFNPPRALIWNWRKKKHYPLSSNRDPIILPTTSYLSNFLKLHTNKNRNPKQTKTHKNTGKHIQKQIKTQP